MATKKNATKNGVAKSAKGTKAVGAGVAPAKASGKSVKAKASAPVETVETVIESTETVLDAQADVTVVVVPEGSAECKPCATVKEVNSDNFSPKEGGGFHSVCKSCRTVASKDWTTKRADYRKQYQRARQLIDLGIPTIVPNAKDWSEGDVLMTIPYERDGVEYPSVPAEGVYEARKATEKADREARNAEAQAKAQADREQRKADREALKAERDAEKAQAKAVRDEERKAEREKKAQERLALAEKAQADRAEAKAKRDAERLETANKKAEEARIAREKKTADRLAKAEQANLAKAQAQADKAEQRKPFTINLTRMSEMASSFFCQKVKINLDKIACKC